MGLHNSLCVFVYHFLLALVALVYSHHLPPAALVAAAAPAGGGTDQLEQRGHVAGRPARATPAGGQLQSSARVSEGVGEK
eukprot:7734051-Alexandrium_andersonii.AAC.1